MKHKNPAPAKPKKKRQTLTPKLKKLALLMPEVIDGKMTLKDAMLKAGYAESSALQQSQAVGSLRNNGAMQEALRKAGLTEEKIANEIMKGVKRLRPGGAHLGYVRTGAELLDAFPSKKIDATITAPLTYADLDDSPKAKTPEEARMLSERGADQ